MEFNIIPDEDALGHCAWCQASIGEHSEVVGLGVRLNPAVDLSAYRSHCIELAMIGRPEPIYMMVTAEGSEAKQNGQDGMFLLCSQACAERLREQLVADSALGELLADFA